ncbi:MAG: FecR domain-containing protein, partial [Bacteroidota bacterium]
MEKNFTKYNSVDFAQESSFIRWVKQGNAADAKFWEGWVSQHPEKAADIEEARNIVRTLRFKETPVDQKQIDALWDKIDAGIEAENNDKHEAVVRSIKPAAQRRVLLRYIASAAAVAILLISFWFLYNPATSIDAGVGEQLAHQLPDASVIQLNAGSTIEYKKGDWSKERTVYLEGEAFFKVEKGSRFTVLTPSGKVEVLGTSFNVFARKGQLEVTCFTGKVRVSKDEQEVILTKGLKTELDATQSALVAAESFETSAAASWRTGEFIFADTPLRCNYSSCFGRGQ